jgi:N-acetylglutamate synthase-like GNAT family acetyltransferase
MHPVVRPATREDVDAFSSMEGKPTVKAWCGELDGKIIALGGLAFAKGRWFIFLDITDDARPYKMTLMRMAKRVMAEAKAMNIRFIYAWADTNEPKSVEWMARLGFHLDPRTHSLYRWKAEE